MVAFYHLYLARCVHELVCNRSGRDACVCVCEIPTKLWTDFVNVFIGKLALGPGTKRCGFFVDHVSFYKFFLPICT